MAALAIGTMVANWVPSDTESTRLDAPGTDGQVQMKTLRTDDGKIILSWLRPERNEHFSYELHLQVFDANGNAQFGPAGITVCDKPTRTWTTDYALALASNGDILLAYSDIRNDVEYEEELETYLYRYTQEGEPVWDPDGVLFPSWDATSGVLSAEDGNPKLCVSDEYIYAAIYRTEYGNRMTTCWEVLRFNDDGTVEPGISKTLSSKILVMCPAGDGAAYFVYDNSDRGLTAEMLDGGLANMWGDPIVIENRPITSGMFVPTPLADLTEDGVLMLSYRVLTDFYGYQVVNYLTPDGQFAPEAVSCNNSIDGDAGTAAMGVKEDRAMVAWEWAYSSSATYMNVNVINETDNFFWTGELMYGQLIDMNTMWGFTPVKVIPTSEGWVLLYGNLTSWNGANFMVVSFDDYGHILWTKQICEENFKSSGFSVVYDDKNAYIFYTQEEQYDDNWNPIPGSAGMYVMCVDITGNPSTAVSEVNTDAQIVKTELYTLDGRPATEMGHGIYIVRTTDANGVVTTKKVKK